MLSTIASTLPLAGAVVAVPPRLAGFAVPVEAVHSDVRLASLTF